MLDDMRVRLAAFNWLAEQVDRFGDVLPRTLLESGFVLDGYRVPLVGPQGIFKPKVLAEMPLSITTSPNSEYDDEIGSYGYLRYRYRGNDPDHPDNRGLRLAGQRNVPLIYFHGIVPGKYVAAWPAYIVSDHPRELCVTVQLDAPSHLRLTEYSGSQEHDLAGASMVSEGRRIYVTREMRVRLHQRKFRERVLEAYRRQCAFCRFRHEELLDAAHIIPDSREGGEPVVSNGLALCSLHHTAFDRHFLGVSPDYEIVVRPDILEEKDGPTLVHGIQALHRTKLLLPRRPELRPDRDRLAQRFEEFRSAV